MIDRGGEDRGSPGHAFANAVGVAGAACFVGLGAGMALPQSFFERFATFESSNQHLIQDIGACQIGLGSVLLLAVVFPGAGPLAVALVGSGIGVGAHVDSDVLRRDLGGRPEVHIPVFAVVAASLVTAGVFNWAASRGGIRVGQ